jgi:hypothetical protein
MILINGSVELRAKSTSYCNNIFQAVFLNEETISLPSEVAAQTEPIPATPSPVASPSLRFTLVSTVPTSFWSNTLEVKMNVRVTQMIMAMLARPDWGEETMNCLSLRQRRRQVENRGRRQPLKTWAMRMT